MLPGSLCHSQVGLPASHLIDSNAIAWVAWSSGATGFRQPCRQLANDLMDFGVAQCSGRYAGPDTRLEEPRSSGSCALILLLLPSSLFITDGASALRRPTPS